MKGEKKMLKQEFLTQLRSGLEAASIEDIDECIEFYDEMISDRIESGMNEESAVAQMESIDSIINNYKAEKPVAKLIMDKVQKSHEEAKGKGKGTLWIVLAIIGFPIKGLMFLRGMRLLPPRAVMIAIAFIVQSPFFARSLTARL